MVAVRAHVVVGVADTNHWNPTDRRVVYNNRIDIVIMCCDISYLYQF